MFALSIKHSENDFNNLHYVLYDDGFIRRDIYCIILKLKLYNKASAKSRGFFLEQN